MSTHNVCFYGELEKIIPEFPEGLLMSTHNICFYGELEKIIPEFPEGLLMNTHNICFYGELEKIITELSLNTPPYQFPLILGYPKCAKKRI